jgi:hypothetical protein
LKKASHLLFLPAYMTVPSMETILYVEMAFPKVTVYSKDKSSGEWSETVHDDLDSSIEIGGQKVTRAGGRITCLDFADDIARLVVRLGRPDVAGFKNHHFFAGVFLPQFSDDISAVADGRGFVPGPVVRKADDVKIGCFLQVRRGTKGKGRAGKLC